MPVGFRLLVPALCKDVGLATKSIHTANQWWDYGGKWAWCPDAHAPTHMAKSDLLELVLKAPKVSSCLCSWVRSGMLFLSSDKLAQLEVLCPLLNAWEKLHLLYFLYTVKSNKRIWWWKPCSTSSCPSPAPLASSRKTCFKMQNWASSARLDLCPCPDTPSKWRDFPYTACLSLSHLLLFCSTTYLSSPSSVPENCLKYFETPCTFLSGKWRLTGF